jgi:hypothetical protein
VVRGLFGGVVAYGLPEVERRDSCDDQVAEEIVYKDNLIIIIKMCRLEKMVVFEIASHLRSINQSPKSRRKIVSGDMRYSLLAALAVCPL